MTYTLLLDTLRDTSFGGMHDDITAYLLDASWNAGMASAYEEVAPPSQMRLTLRNTGGEFDPEVLGPELVSNSNFTTWSGGNPSNWTVTGESGSDPEVSQVGASKLHGEGGTGWCNLYTSSAAAPISISQNILTAGNRYRVTFTIGAVGGTGGVVVKCGTAAVSPVYHAPGVKTVYFTASGASFKIETDGAADVTIDDVSVKATSRYAGALVRGTLVRLKFNATVLYEGKIAQIVPVMGDYTERAVQVTVSDAMVPLLQADYQAELLTDATIDQALDDIFDKAVIAYPYAHRFWMLEVEGSSELGTTTTLYTHAATDFDTGSTTLAYIGDNLDRGQGVNAQTVIRDLVATEFGGRFYWQPRTGKFVFDSRHRDMLDTTSDASFTVSAFHQVVPAFGDDVANVILLDYEPRVVGAAGTVLWSDTTVPFALAPGETRTIQARYHDVDNEQMAVGASVVLPLARGLDLVGNRQQNGSGADMSSVLEYSLDAGGASARLTVWSRHPRLTIYVTALQLRGTPILRYPRETKTAQDGDSFRDTDYRLEKQISIPALGDGTTAEAGANYLLGKFKTQKVQLRQVTMVVSDGSSNLAAVLARTLCDRITISDATTGHDADYFIVGEQHSLRGGGWNVHEVTWVLKPASREQFWLLEASGYSELDTSTRLAF